MDRNYRGMNENCGRIDLIRGGQSPQRNINREKNALNNELVYSSVFNVELQLYIYRILTVSMAHMT